MYTICYCVSRNSRKINVINFICYIFETNNMLYCIYNVSMIDFIKICELINLITNLLYFLISYLIPNI